MGEYQGVTESVEEALRDMPPLNQAEGVDLSLRCQAEFLRLSSLLRQNDSQQIQRAATDGWAITFQLKRDVGLEHPDVLDIMCNTARAFVENNQLDDGEVLHSEVLEARKKVLGHEHICTLESMENLALVFQSQGKHTRSEELLREVLRISKATLKSDDPSTVTTMENLAQLLAWQEGRLPDATALNLEALELNCRVLGPEHSNTLISRYNLACTYEKQQQMPEAIRLMTEVAESFEKKLGQEHPEAKEAREASESWKERERGESSRKVSNKRRRTN